MPKVRKNNDNRSYTTNSVVPVVIELALVRLDPPRPIKADRKSIRRHRTKDRLTNPKSGGLGPDNWSSAGHADAKRRKADKLKGKEGEAS